MPFKHTSMTGYRIDVEKADTGTLKRVLVIQSNLKTDPLESGYDRIAEADLLDAGYRFVRDPKNQLDLVKLEGLITG